MTWVVPHTWITDEQITGSLLNETRDNLLAIAHPYDTSNSDVDVVSTAVETTIYSVTITGGSLGTSGMLELVVLGDQMMNNAAGDVATLRVKWGGSTIFTGTGTTNSANGTRHPSGVHLWLANRAANSQLLVCAMQLGMPSGGATGLVTAGGVGIGGITATSAVDSTMDQTLAVTAQWSAASAGNSWRKRLAFVRLGQN